jgi:hypothetical protein
MGKALAGKNRQLREEAIQAELEQLKKYKVYEEIDELPPGKKSVDTEWVLREKLYRTIEIYGVK